MELSGSVTSVEVEEDGEVEREVVELEDEDEDVLEESVVLDGERDGGRLGLGGESSSSKYVGRLTRADCD